MTLGPHPVDQDARPKVQETSPLYNFLLANNNQRTLVIIPEDEPINHEADILTVSHEDSLKSLRMCRRVL